MIEHEVSSGSNYAAESLLWLKRCSVIQKIKQLTKIIVIIIEISKFLKGAALYLPISARLGDGSSEKSDEWESSWQYASQLRTLAETLSQLDAAKTILGNY